MKTTIEWLDDVKSELKLPSDYAAAKALGVTRSTVSAYRNGKSTFDEDTCFRVAEILGVRAFEVVASTHVERARDDRHRDFWMDALEKFSRGFRWLAVPANACRAWPLQV
ncbi:MULTISPECIES: helix-turn-helix transcriptional regulator [unclassified Caballeronia]|uniref:helix-turn-helix transcriptional regulator n=1 Tax=unclassified Caballeronia TaxID=2646786 RepID=UPI00285FF0BC|nr:MULTISPECIES: helix-turn-helix transcriptional regulator [unclassified Caballeronia]MDR5771488.1 helix-turn-helix transcriptional regulator [Caballeronia sp. LZ002]MDR5805249.1 helix-turn-helix transcriptional regulator [Caballeronia sp. LZ001]MDR5846924.1 helix-turn-helix transcriptional regulator [Caballeronia sp. LZ003]